MNALTATSRLLLFPEVNDTEVGSREAGATQHGDFDPSTPRPRARRYSLARLAVPRRITDPAARFGHLKRTYD